MKAAAPQNQEKLAPRIPSNKVAHLHQYRSKVRKKYVLTLLENSGSKTEPRVVQTLIWDSSHPLSLGHPFQWMIERRPDGLLIRYIATPIGAVIKNAHLSVSKEEILSGKPIELPYPKAGKTKSFYIELRAIDPLPPAFLTNTFEKGQQLQIFTCLGDWVMRVRRIDSSYRARSLSASQNAFDLKKDSAGNVEVKVSGEHITLHHDKDGSRELKIGDKMKLTPEEMGHVSFTQGNTRWYFAYSNAAKVVYSKEDTKQSLDKDGAWFKKAITAAGLVLFLFSSTLMLTKPEEVEVADKELVPVQYAKLVYKAKSSNSAAPQAGAPLKAPEQVEVAKNKPNEAPTAKPKTTAAMAQAVRARALQSSISGLLKGGMSNLLAKSSLVTNQNVNSMFSKTTTQALTANNFSDSIKTPSALKVAGLGGGKEGATGVGYGSGNVANVNGQGSNFVDLDTFGSAVAQGLTKDEVGKVIHAHLSEVRYCYESAMLRNPDVEGKLIVNFTIGGTGYVRTSAVKNSTLADAQLDDCILRRLGKWEFPKPKGGVNVAVTYPFIFKTLGR